MPQHELIAVGWHGTHEFRKSKDKSVLFYPRPSRSVFHPTQKSIPLLRHLLLNSSRIGDAVYEPFLGSGSLLLAAEQTKRRCIGIELDPAYCKVVMDRFETLTGIRAEALPSPSRP
jgi:site-specific DNA-methyltransferase (adenine-specific)